MKIGVLGGTFNPIHNSHLYISLEYARILGLGKVLLIPTFTPPHKPSGELIDARHRLAMCELAAQSNPLFEVCGFEASRPEKSFTYKTLEYLKQKYPDDSLYFLMGADMFLTVQQWKNPGRIYVCATLCAAAREEGERQKLEEHSVFLKEQGANSIVIEAAPKPLSSTDIRAAVVRGEDISGMVPDGVARYIAENGLYTGGR